MLKYCKVAVNCPLREDHFTYLYSGDQGLVVGSIVDIPFGRRKAIGFILELDSIPSKDFDRSKLKEVIGIHTTDLSIKSDELNFYKWIAKYYHYPLGKLIADTLPKILKRPRELKYEKGIGEAFDFKFTPDQEATITKISENLSKGFTRHLIHGVTGSGKTAIYLNLIQKTILEGKSVLFLLPEINLTPQFIKSFIKHINAPIYSYNSAISNSDKYGLWKLLEEDESPKVIIGVRSAIFLPLKNIGLIVVDEEHDQSFKQDDRCTYNARDIAYKKAQIYKVPIILGSATPSVETYNNFKNPKDKITYYFSLQKRVGTSKLPIVELESMKHHGKTQVQIDKEKDYWPFTSNSIDEVRQALDRDEQVLVFINRLGYASYLQCKSCGHQFSCPNCSTNLRYFKNRNEVSCQYCEYKDTAPIECPECQNMSLFQKGFGTERLQQILANFFPDKTVERFDRDEIKNFKQLESRLDDFHSGKVDIMVGTQMLSKGHNFERVNLVLILGIDGQLNFPDFRALEKVYQLLTQVSGRSGRYGKDSKVLIHTLGSENNIFSYVQKHSFHNFYEDELELREVCNCPPFTKIAMIYLSSKFQDRLIDSSVRLKDAIVDLSEKHFNSVEVLGPRPALVEKKVNKFTWCMMLRSSDLGSLHGLIDTVLKNVNLDYSISIKLDVDPYSIS